MAFICPWGSADSVEENRPATFDASVFDMDTPSVEEKPETTSGKNKVISFGGFMQQSMAYSYEAEDFKLSQVRSSLDLRMDIDFSDSLKAKVEALGFYDSAYAIEGRSDFTQATLDTYESDVRLQEAYLDLDVTNWLNIRAGRQYFGWGTSDGAQVGDIGNPRDLRELGLQDVEDARLPVGATKMTLYGTDWEYNLISIHEFRPNELGAEGSAYDPFISLRRMGGNILEGDEPDSTLENSEIITRLFLSRSFGDISLFAGETYNDLPVFSLSDYDPNLIWANFVPEYAKYQRFGIFGNLVSGPLLFKYDIAQSIDEPLNHSAQNIAAQIAANAEPIRGWSEADALQVMLGLEYSGISETFLSLEIYRKSIQDYPTDTYQDEKDVTEVSLYLSRDFWNDRLITTFWVNRLITQSATMFRVDATYAVNDNLEVSLAFTGMDSNDSQSYFYDYRKTDRGVLTIKYSF